MINDWRAHFAALPAAVADGEPPSDAPLAFTTVQSLAAATRTLLIPPA